MSSHPEAYELELRLEPAEPGSALFDVTVRDFKYFRQEAGAARLPIGSEKLPQRSLEAKQFLTDFRQGEATSLPDALAYGRLLLEALLAEAPIRLLWEESQQRRTSAKQPLRLRLVLPPGQAEGLAEVPFELLADQGGFLFRRFGAALVRTVEGFEAQSPKLPAGARAGLAWANPKQGDAALDGKLLARHEEALPRLARAFGLEAAQPCQQATFGTLGKYLASSPPLSVLSLLAHGFSQGGGLLLHNGEDPRFPEDEGLPLSARDIAGLLRRGGVEVALLWSCHASAHHPYLGAVAEALLDPNEGDVKVVLASHAALLAKLTPELLEGLAA
nr:hypothetical protein [Thermoanaerobaculia bacterium]